MFVVSSSSPPVVLTVRGRRRDVRMFAFGLSIVATRLSMMHLLLAINNGRIVDMDHNDVDGYP